MSGFLETIMRYVMPSHPEHTEIVQKKADFATNYLEKANEEASRLNAELLELQASLAPPQKKGHGR